VTVPATRTLNAAGYSSLRQLAGVPRSDPAKLHGMGPKALDILDKELKRHNLRLGSVLRCITPMRPR
jgi:3-deoxy-D-arabino-heptulosonate 7-phosphate (DAHP) synthase